MYRFLKRDTIIITQTPGPGMLTPMLQLHISVEYRTHVDIYVFLVDIFQRIDLGRYKKQTGTRFPV